MIFDSVSYFVVRSISEEIQLAGTDEAGDDALVGMRAQVLKPRQRFWVPTSGWRSKRRTKMALLWLLADEKWGEVVGKTMISMRP
jgi:hypothetical protein